MDMQLKFVFENSLHFIGYNFSLLTGHSSGVAAMKKQHRNHRPSSALKFKILEKNEGG